MNPKANELKDHIIESLGRRIVQELDISDQALLDLGLSTNREYNTDPEGLQSDAFAFTLITENLVLPTELVSIVDTFVRNNNGNSGCNNTASPRTIIWINHIAFLYISKN
jgi:hypothetical protein